jgi:hypothetical protein
MRFALCLAATCRNARNAGISHNGIYGFRTTDCTSEITTSEITMMPIVTIGLTLICAIAAAVAVIGEFRRDDQEP